jgi:hypothetical protein
VRHGGEFVARHIGPHAQQFSVQQQFGFDQDDHIVEQQFTAEFDVTVVGDYENFEYQ